MTINLTQNVYPGTDSPTEGVNRQNVSSPDSFGTDLHEIYFGQDDYVPKFTPTTILSPTILPVASVVKTKEIFDNQTNIFF